MQMTVGRAHLSGHYIRKRLRTAVPARRAAAFAAVLLVVAIVLFRQGGIDFATLRLMAAGVFGLAVLALVTALAGLVRVWHSGREGGGAALGALTIALLVIVPFGLAGVLASQYPRTNSAETDAMMVNDMLAGVTVNEGAAAELADGGASLTGRRFQASAAQVYAVARLVIEDKGWTLVDVVTEVSEDDAENATGDLGTSGTVGIPLPTPRATTEAPVDRFALPEAKDYALTVEARDFLLRLPSDMAIRIVEDGNETFVDLRSTSRAVTFDLGQNRRFIEDFLARLDEGMAGVTAVLPAKDG
jgi:hypothetical protein